MIIQGKEIELGAIEKTIEMALENCACLGGDAYGEYITNLTNMIMTKIRELEEPIK